jgi:phosphatidylglycerol---prolipoprotein diacylglyceryl transferase
MSTALVHPQFDPVALAIGPVAIHWYGLMYLVAFAAFYFVGRYQLRTRADLQASGLTPKDLEDLLFVGALGVVIGGRLGYTLFYQPGYYLAHPLEILAVWQGGMAFHGGLLGVIAALAWFAYRRTYLASGPTMGGPTISGPVRGTPPDLPVAYASFGQRFWAVADFVAPLVPLGLAAGRLGNFINGELWGRVADPNLIPWAMVFPQSGSDLARHPSQLYQFMGEGLILFAILFWLSGRRQPRGMLSAVFLLGYGCLRFVAEFGREPDAFLGLLAFGGQQQEAAIAFSMGQWLSLPMIVLGLIGILICRRSRP